MSESPTFTFKQFALTDRRCAMKIGTDGVIVGALCSLPKDAVRVADIGSGSGLISLMIAQRFPKVSIDAIEIDENACMDLRTNVDASPWKDRIRCINADFESITEKYDLIVSNPPYFTSGQTSPDSSRALARHANNLSALTLIDFAATHLTEIGALVMIIPSSEAAGAIESAIYKRLYLALRTDIITSGRRGITRSVLQFVRDPLVVPEISVLDSSSKTFKDLTADFYLN